MTRCCFDLQSISDRMYTMSKHKVISRVSRTVGSDIRHVYTEDGQKLLGMILKLGRGKYRVLRMDGKERTKESLTEAFKTIRRAN